MLDLSEKLMNLSEKESFSESFPILKRVFSEYSEKLESLERVFEELKFVLGEVKGE